MEALVPTKWRNLERAEQGRKVPGLTAMEKQLIWGMRFLMVPEYLATEGKGEVYRVSLCMPIVSEQPGVLLMLEV